MLSSEIRLLLTHSSIYGLGTVVSQLVAFIMLPIYTHYLTPADYGVLETISISSGIIAIIITVGIVRAMSRFYYEPEEKDERNKVVSTSYITYIGIALLAAPAVLALSSPLSQILLGSNEHVHLFQVGFVTLMISPLIDIGLMYLRLLKNPLVFLSVTVTRLFFLILFNLIFLVYFKAGPIGILYSSLIVSGCYACGMTLVILRRTRLLFSSSLAKGLISYSLPIIPSNLGNTLVKQSDKYFILHFLSVADMGTYSLALRIGNAIHNLFTAPFNLAYVPRRFEIVKMKEARETYSRVFTYYIFVVVYVGLFISVLIPDILHVIVSPKFLKAKDIIPLVVVSMIILGSHYHFDFGILYSKKTKYLSYIGLSCAVVQVGLNYILIGKYGFFGAVWSSIISLTLQAFLLYVVSQRFYQVRYEFGRIGKFLLLALFFYGLSTRVQTSMLWLTVALKLTILTLFPVILLVFRIITHQEKIRIKEIYNVKVKPLLYGKAAVRVP